MEFVLQPVLGEEFEITRADLISSPGSINVDIIQRIYNVPLVVADITGFNPNVMYEVGVRHSFNKPIVQLSQSGQKLPFDIATERTIFFDLTDIRSIEDAKNRIKESALQALNTAEYVGPIHRALNVAAVMRDGSDVAEAIETLSEQVEAFGHEIFATVGNYSDSDLDGKIDFLHGLFSGFTDYDMDRLRRFLKKKMQEADFD